MRFLNITQIFLAHSLLLLAANVSFAADLNTRVNSLGGNKELIRKAKALDPDNKMRVVQRRAVDRTLRLEFGVNYGLVSGGDPYLNSQTVGGLLDFHINPHWSVGARHYEHYNELTPEGRRVFDDAKAMSASGDPYVKPAVDYPLSSTLAVVSLYPFYGKLNLFDMGVAQFDVYVLGGYGQMKLESGSAPTWSAGGGIGLWMSQHFSSRLETRYQAYEDKIYTGSRDMNIVVTTFSIGFLL